MYFHMLLKKDVVIFPKDFGPNMQQRLIDKLIEKVEGSCSGRYGFVICVTEVVTLGKGKIREGGRLRGRVVIVAVVRGHLRGTYSGYPLLLQVRAS